MILISDDFCSFLAICFRFIISVPHRDDGRFIIECFYFKFCFVLSGNTSSANAVYQADKLSTLKGKTELANGRQILSNVEKN